MFSCRVYFGIKICSVSCNWNTNSHSMIVGVQNLKFFIGLENYEAGVVVVNCYIFTVERLEGRRNKVFSFSATLSDVS